MIRVAFLVRSLERGGSERQLVTLARAMDQDRFQPTVVCFYGGGPLQRDLVDAGVPVVALDKCGRWDLPGFLDRLIKELRGLRPDVLHSYLEVPNAVATTLRPLLPGTRLVWGVRNSKLDLSPYDWLARAGFIWSRILSRRADLIIANSKSGRDYYARCGYPRDRMIVIPNGIDINRFRPLPEAGARLRAEWGVPPEATLLGLVARLDPVKDHPTFLRAAGLLANDWPHLHFVCVGGGAPDYKTRLEELARTLGLSRRLSWAGERCDMAEAYSALDISCSSSYSEGFSNVIAEAMACSVPCVVTDVGDSALIVGETGVVVPPRDPGALAEGWRELLSEGPIALGRRGRAARSRVAAEFSVDKLVQRTEGALAELVAGRREHRA